MTARAAVRGPTKARNAGETGEPGGRDRMRRLGDLPIDLAQVSVGRVGRGLGEILDRSERDPRSVEAPAGAAKSPERTRGARHPESDRPGRAIVTR